MSLQSNPHQMENHLAVLLEEVQKKVKVGEIYFHYKSPDKHYKVLAVALLEDNEKPAVVYQALYGSYLIWVRPVDNWLAEVEWNGEKMPRFQLFSKTKS